METAIVFGAALLGGIVGWTMRDYVGKRRDERMQEEVEHFSREKEYWHGRWNEATEQLHFLELAATRLKARFNGAAGKIAWEPVSKRLHAKVVELKKKGVHHG